MSLDNKNCALCGVLANLMCQRCLESYCSMNCQIIDWPQHKLMCISIPPLIPKQSVKMINRKPVFNYLAGTKEHNEINPENKTENLKQSHIQIRQLHDNADNMRRPRLERPEIFDQNTNNSNSNNNKAVSISINDNILTQIDNMVIKSTESIKNDISTNYDDENSLQTLCSNRTVDIVKNKDDCRIEERFKHRSNLNKIQNNSDVNNKSNINDRLNKCREMQKIERNNEQIFPKLMENPGFKKDYGLINNNTPYVNQLVPERQNTNKSSELNNCNIITKSTKDITTPYKPWKVPFPFPKDKSDFKATVQYVDPIAKLIWLTEISLDSHAVKLLKQINTNIQQAVKATINDIDIDNLVASPFADGLYYRAIVLDKINKKNEVRVRLVDYGNDFKINIDELKLPSLIMKNLNAYSFCCRYNKHSEIGKILNIRVIGKESDDIFLIEEIEETVENQSVVKFLSNSIDIILMNIFNEKSKALAVVLDKNTKIELDKLNEILISEETFQYDIVTKPKNGDLIAGRNKEWKRGIIIDQCNNKYLIFFIDFGEVEIVEQIKILPKTFLKIPPQSILLDVNRISIDSETFNSQYFCNLKVFTLKKTGKVTSELSIDCDLYDNKNTKISEITLNHFNGDFRNIEYLNFWNIPLLNNDIVRITHVIDYFNIYISLNSVNEIYSNIFKEIYNLKTIEILKNPEINNIILCNNNNKYERCRVLEKIDTTTYHVRNIDTGFEFNINSNKIKLGNDFIKFMPIYTMKCSLDIINILKKPIDLINNKAVEVLKNFCTAQQEFILQIGYNNVVELFFNNNNRNSLNKELIPILDEMNNNNSIEKTSDNIKFVPEEDKLYELNDIKVVPIPTGENVKILILDNSTLRQGTVTGSICDLEFVDKYYSEYQPKINEYCNSNTEEYSPQKNELCITIYEDDGQWYRALCLETKPNDQFNLKFIDFGNTKNVNKSNIRIFHKDFLFPRIANICKVDGLPSTLTDKQINTLTPILHANGAIIVDKVEIVNNTYLIRIEGIEELLEMLN